MEIVEKSACYGCGACYNVCPVDAIEMKKNPEGFLMPEVDDDKCINCNRCKDVCPAIHFVYNKASEPKILAFQAAGDLLKEGSSGSVFPLLAKDFINNGGFVFGAVFDENWTVKHIGTDNVVDLEKIAFSKYLQSDTNDTFKKVRELLIEGKKVLYAGCPCQIAGLNLFLNKNYENLITIDILCHGIPSPGSFFSYLEENFEVEKIENIEFRRGDKWSTIIGIDFNDGTREEYPCRKNSYMRTFLNDFNLRETCYGCKYSRLPRQGDITIGDLWGARKLRLGFPQQKTSVVLLNTAKAEDAFFGAAVSAGKSHYLKELSLKTRHLNGNIFRSIVGTEKLRDRRVFFKTYTQYGFNKAAYEAMGNFKTGLILYLSSNYGSMASNLSLYEFLKRKNVNPILCDTLVGPMGEGAELFAGEYMECASDRFRKNDHGELNKALENFVVGSDMTWNLRVMGMRKRPEYMMLGFADDRKRKIAYGPSFGSGRKQIDNDKIALCSYFLKRFDKIAVREKEGKDICKELFGCDVDVEMDPFFLSEPEMFINIADFESKYKNEKYVLSYILDPSEVKIKIIKEIAEKKGINLHIIPDLEADADMSRERFGELSEAVISPDFKTWVHLFVNAEYIVTDSFHGSCMSLLLDKDFIAFRNRSKYRFDNLGQRLNVADRMINPEDHTAADILEKDKIDYPEVRKALSDIRRRGEEWWEEALEGKRSDVKEAGDAYALSLLCSELLRKKQAFYERGIGFLILYHEDETAEPSMITTFVCYGEHTKTLTVSQLGFGKKGYDFSGWKIYREYDNKWYVSDDQGKALWHDMADGGLPSGFEHVLYNDGSVVAKMAPGGIVHLYGTWK